MMGNQTDREGVNDELCSTTLAFLSLIQGLAFIFPWEMPKPFQIKQIYSCILVLNVYIIGGPRRWQQVGRVHHPKALAWALVTLLWLCMVNNATEKVTELEQGLIFKS